MATPLRLLVLEDQQTDAELMVAELRRAGFEPEWRRIDTEADFLASLEPAPDLVLADYHLPSFNAMRALRQVQNQGLDIPFIVVSATLSDEEVVACIKQGATDYILKDRRTRLGHAVVHALEEGQKRAQTKHKKKVLNEAQKRLRAVCDPTKEAIEHITLDQHLREVNEAFIKLTSHSNDEVLTELAATFHQMTENLQRISLSRETLAKEVILRKKAEEELKQSNAAIQAVHKKLEKRNAQLKESDRLKDEFVNNVSHELRTPLTVIRESIAQISEGFFGEVQKEQNKYLRKSIVSIDRLVNIISNMLDLAKIERRKATLVKQRVNIKSLVEDVVSDFELKIKARGLRLRSEFPPNEITAFVDQEKIIQVLSNLISNAIKYTERGHILVSIAEKDNFVECHVSDTGKGIAEKDLPKLFNKFEQVARQLTLAEKGTGLGLAISKRIVQLHGGKIYAASEEGKGSTFTFTMPMWSLKKGTVRDLKGLFGSAINKFNQFTIIKLVGLQEQPLTIQTPLLCDVIARGLYRKADKVIQDGNTMCVLLPDTRKEDCPVVVGRIQQELAMHVDIQMTSYPDDGLTADELILELEVAKGAGDEKNISGR